MPLIGIIVVAFVAVNLAVFFLAPSPIQPTLYWIGNLLIAAIGTAAALVQLFTRPTPPAPAEGVGGEGRVSPAHGEREGGGETASITQHAGDDSIQIVKARDVHVGDTIIQPPPPHIPLHRPPRAQHFQGRRDEIDAALRHLQPGRFVTLCGPGGIGKTAIAREVVDRLAPANDVPERFPDGVFLHNFYTHPKADVALGSIAATYGIESRPDPHTAARLALSRRTALLILDGAENADDLPAVLDIAGNCAVLITTRHRSDARGELIVVEPLPDASAISLFWALAGPRSGDDEIVKHICQLVGNLPLALQLAGSYVKRTQIDAARYLKWLKDTPLAALDFGARQHDSVPLLIQRSLEQVSDDARAALSVVGLLAFAPFSLDTVAAALDRDPDGTACLLGELVAFNLLHRPQDRYTVPHALIHTYASKRLDPPPKALFRLATHFAQVVRDGLYQSWPVLPEPCYYDIMLHAWAVLQACYMTDQSQLAEDLFQQMQDYLNLHNQRNRQMMAEATARRRKAKERVGILLLELAQNCISLGQFGLARQHLHESLAIFEEIESPYADQARAQLADLDANARPTAEPNTESDVS